MKSKIVLNFTRRSDANVEILSASVLASMTNNASFPNPTPALADVLATHELFSAALSAAQNRDRFRVAQKNEARQNLEAQLTRLSHYVTLTADGNRAIQISSGFPVNAEKATVKRELGTIEHFTVTLGANSGEVWLSVTPVTNARYYHYYVTPADTDTPVWEQYGDTVTSFLITNLESLKKYSFRVKALGIKGQFADSVIITKAVV